MALVETRELFAVYPSPTGGVAALRGLTLTVGEGEICVVLGPSGSGKTTLMRVLAGLHRPSAGTAIVAGFDLVRASGRALMRYRSQMLGYADQHYWRALADELTAEELIGVPLGLASAPEDLRQSRAHELLERVGLLDRSDALTSRPEISTPRLHGTSTPSLPSSSPSTALRQSSSATIPLRHTSPIGSCTSVTDG